jgi:hypothetical protein
MVLTCLKSATAHAITPEVCAWLARWGRGEGGLTTMTTTTTGRAAKEGSSASAWVGLMADAAVGGGGRTMMKTPLTT